MASSIRADNITIHPHGGVTSDIADCGHCLVRKLGRCRISGGLTKANQDCNFKFTTSEIAEAVIDMGAMQELVKRSGRVER